jgi:hypothetical protein
LQPSRLHYGIASCHYEPPEVLIAVFTFVRADNAAALIVAALFSLAFAPGAGLHATPCDQCQLNPAGRAPAARQVAQAGDGGDETEIAPAQVDKYIAVYAAMQRNHSLTVEQAAARQGLTVSAFRDLENRILRNPSVHDRVLRALRAAAKAHAPNLQPAPKSKPESK